MLPSLSSASKTSPQSGGLIVLRISLSCTQSVYLTVGMIRLRPRMHAGEGSCPAGPGTTVQMASTAVVASFPNLYTHTHSIFFPSIGPSSIDSLPRSASRAASSTCLSRPSFVCSSVLCSRRHPFVNRARWSGQQGTRAAPLTEADVYTPSQLHPDFRRVSPRCVFPKGVQLLARTSTRASQHGFDVCRRASSRTLLGKNGRRGARFHSSQRARSCGAHEARRGGRRSHWEEEANRGKEKKKSFFLGERTRHGLVGASSADVAWTSP
mmetsp:Transcript_2088/g.13466  ORF Transcript_2088/g.13466 Transcript_2088/m.13466 type:complete len:267 (-) Transcript_2088:4369-5169(-)